MKNKGFTLVELLATITIMGLLSLLIIPQVARYIKHTTDTTYDTYKHTLSDATKNYLMDHTEDIPYKIYSPSENGPKFTITAKDLIEKGYMDSLEDPENNKLTCDDSSRVVVMKIADKKFDYHVYLVCGNINVEEHYYN